MIPALETGVRTAIVASVLVILIFLVNSRWRLRQVFVVVAVIGVMAGSGAFAVAENRVTKNLSSGEFSSLATAGSGRGAIWSVALSHYFAASAAQLVMGTGLRSIGQFEQEDLGRAFVGHSDLTEVGVRLGLVGFAGWIIIWLVLLTDASLSRIVLVPIIVYAVITGAIEATAPIVVGLFFAAAASSVALSDLLPQRVRSDAKRATPPRSPALVDT